MNDGTMKEIKAYIGSLIGLQLKIMNQITTIQRGDETRKMQIAITAIEKAELYLKSLL